MKSMNNDMPQAAANAFQKRLAKDRRFKWYGILAISLALSFLLLIFAVIFSNGYSILQQTRIALTLDLSALHYDLKNPLQTDFSLPVNQAIYRVFPEVQTRKGKAQLRALMSRHAQYELRDAIKKDPSLSGKEVTLHFLADSEVDLYVKGRTDPSLPESDRRLSDQQIEWIDTLKATGKLALAFNTSFFTSGSSRNPEQAGILAALIGSLYAMLITFMLAFPLGIGAAIYLEEFAPSNRFADMIEININNLAAVPSIIFGLLGLAIFINFFDLPRSTPLVGGIVLALMTLPTIIIASRAALKAVPDSIREAAFGLGASRVQVVFHHVIPLAMPGMLTGSIIGMAQALGESAPLMMIGMVAFIADIPGKITDPSTVLPVQIFIWSKYPEAGFIERAAGAIIVLLVILFIINAIAIFLRKRLERRW